MQLPSYLLLIAAAIGAVATPQPIVVSEGLPQRPPTRILPYTKNPKINLAYSPPPRLMRKMMPSPECHDLNGGELQCCRALYTGDNETVQWLAKIYGYNLTPDIVNGLNCDDQINNCPAVRMCCRVTRLSPLLSMWCESANDKAWK